MSGPRVTLTIVNPFKVVILGVYQKIFSESFSVYTSIGDTIMDRTYKHCNVKVSSKVTSKFFVELEMVDFDIILDSDWLHSIYE